MSFYVYVCISFAVEKPKNEHYWWTQPTENNDDKKDILINLKKDRNSQSHLSKSCEKCFNREKSQA